jgi:PmbA protein
VVIGFLVSLPTDELYRRVMMEKIEAKRKLMELADSLLAQAKAKGVTSAEVSASLSTGLSAQVRMQEVDTVEFNRDQGLSITVYYDHCKGSASTSDISPTALTATLDAACEIAKITASDPYAGLPEPDELAMEYPDCDVHHPWDINAEQAIEMAMETERLALARDSRLTNSEGASISTHDSSIILANSLGFRGAYAATRHSISCSLIATKGESMERDYYYTTARRVDRLDSLEQVAEQAARRTLRRLGARHLSTQQVPVVFAPDVAIGLIGHFLGAIRGSNLYRKSSFLLDSIGQTVFPTFMTIEEYPHLPSELGSAPFDGDGVRTRDNIFVKDGVLESYLLSTYSARRLALKNTGNGGGIHNCRLTSSPNSWAQA